MKIAVLCIGAAVLAFAFALSYSSGPKRPTSVVPKTSSFEFPRRKPIITQAEYSRIQSGMSYWDVQSVIGKPGVEVSSGRSEGVPGVMESISTVAYSWTNNDGTNMIAMFQNDKLIQKAQFGLK